MIKTFVLAGLAAFSLLAAGPAHAAVKIGQPAPDFTATDSNGKQQKLSDYKGKIVVLEWTNPECPFVKHHYNDLADLQKLQETYTGKGVVWLRVNSSAQGKEGYSTAEDTNKYVTDHKVNATATIIDPTGAVGKDYDAKTTPHMFVIDADGKLVYNGALDNNDTFKPLPQAEQKNYVADALDAVLAGKPVATAQTKPYGCGVKYE